MTAQAEQSQASGELRGQEPPFSGTLLSGARAGLAEMAAKGRGKVRAMIRENLSTIVIILTILGSIPLFINPRFDALEASVNARFVAVDARFDALDAKLTARMDALEARLTARIDAVDAKLSARIDAVESNLGARIDAVDAKIDNKFNNLANMMIIAHTNGDVTAEELVAIWEQVKTV